MTVRNTTGAVSTHAEDKWQSIPWDTANREVMKLQVRIAKATREGRWNKVKSLQWLLTHSYYAKCMAVKRITTNRGKNTPGTDGIVLDTSVKKYQTVLKLKRRNYRPLPLRRVYIPKSNGKRPLGIPTIFDRAMQALHLLALLPVSESTADDNSYGFRPGRCTADAIEALFGFLSRSFDPQWILEGDIKGCFDNIGHGWIIENVCMDTVVLNKWLKAGYVEKSILFPTNKGTPQGGIISPCISNVVLDGMEDLLGKTFGSFKETGSYYRQRKTGIRFVRYADDWVVVSRSREVLEKEVKPLIEGFLKERGLELSQEKTKITHISEGFNFLGQNIRKYDIGKGKQKLLIKPSVKNVHSFLTEIKGTIRKMATAKQENLIQKLNPMIRGWANFHHHVVSKEVFNKVDYLIWLELWKWAKRRHPNKGKRWVNRRYFGPVKGVNRSFHCTIRNKEGHKVPLALLTASSVPIIRHTKIRALANPFDPQFKEYFEKRIAFKMRNKQYRNTVTSLWKKQSGSCPECGDLITSVSNWKIQSRIGSLSVGSTDYQNQSLLHPECFWKGQKYGYKFASPVKPDKCLT